MSASLPVVDISPFLSTSSTTLEQRNECAKSISTACRDSGFFYLTNHGIPPERTNEILHLARTFFLEASEEEKMSIARKNPGVENGDGARGWQRVGENVTQGRRDWHEGLDLYQEDNHGEPPYDTLMGRNLWPKTPAQLRERYDGYISDMLSLGTAVVRAMGYALDPKDEDMFVRATRHSFWVMRLIGYPPLPSDPAIDNEAGISCGEHTDYGCVTLLLADSTKGALQVQHKSGQWIDADPMPGAFVVNIGDMIERWTNGLWKSTNHRVIHKGEQWRFSVPFFFEPDFEARIAPLGTCLRDTGGVAKYEEVVYGDFLRSKVEGNFDGDV
jgi:isopenicillin N synthase-like dioxygenase